MYLQSEFHGIATFQKPRRWRLLEETTQESVEGNLTSQPLHINCIRSCSLLESCLQGRSERGSACVGSHSVSSATITPSKTSLYLCGLDYIAIYFFRESYTYFRTTDCSAYVLFQ